MNGAAKFACLALLLLSLGWRLGAQAPPSLAPLKQGASTPPAPAFKVDVDLVQVEVGVHDEHGRAVGNLSRDDFHVFEDGVEQQISFFAHEEQPLALALVIDNSSSIMAALHELRRGALDTLALLKPIDQVAIFSFAEKPEMEEALTSNHEALSVDLYALNPYGGTALNDGLYDAALYLGRDARGRRRAVILVSDNEPSDEQTRDVPEVVRAAEQSGTPIYSVKVGNLEHSRGFFLSHSEPRIHDVEKICKLTGGELIDTRNGMPVNVAMETIIKWLKQGYTLGYYPTNRRDDGGYRAIQVRLNEHGEAHRGKDTLYTQPGYYAPNGQ